MGSIKYITPTPIEELTPESTITTESVEGSVPWWVWLIAISIIVLSIIACYQVLDNTIHSEITKEKAFYHNKKDYSNKKAIIVIDDISYEVDIKKLSNDSFCVKHVNRYNILGELKETYYKICECNIKGKAIPIEL